MKLTLAFLTGVMVALSLRFLPKRPWFHDQPVTPADWKPKYRYWNGGVEQ